MGLFDRFKKKDKKEESVEKIEFASDLENRVLFNKATECLQERKNEEAIELFEAELQKYIRDSSSVCAFEEWMLDHS